jgi:uncharacterized membrane protein YccC
MSGGWTIISSVRTRYLIEIPLASGALGPTTARGESEFGMRLISPRKNAILYIAKLFTGSTIVWFGLKSCGIDQPYWAMISLIVVTEPDVNLAKTNFNARLINTFNGTVVACLALVVLGPTFLAMLCALMLATLIAMSLQNYPANWRLAPNTAVVIMAAALTGNGLPEELKLAALRVVEVLTGSAVALFQSIVYGHLLKRWNLTID